MCNPAPLTNHDPWFMVLVTLQHPALLPSVHAGLVLHRRSGFPGRSPGRGPAAALRAAKAPPADAL